MEIAFHVRTTFEIPPQAYYPGEVPINLNFDKVPG